MGTITVVHYYVDSPSKVMFSTDPRWYASAAIRIPDEVLIDLMLR